MRRMKIKPYYVLLCFLLFSGCIFDPSPNILGEWEITLSGIPGMEKMQLNLSEQVNTETFRGSVCKTTEDCKEVTAWLFKGPEGPAQVLIVAEEFDLFFAGVLIGKHSMYGIVSTGLSEFKQGTWSAIRIEQ